MVPWRIETVVSMAVGEEHRKHRRYNLSLPVRVRVKAQPSLELPATTRDISSAGIYLMMSQDMQPGSGLEFEITLPGEVSGGKTVRIRCRGKIVRVNRQKGEDKVGVAARIERFEFVTGT